jgi:diguanylate cyclase (GGDEF)-like protein/PAS domain S-box-containing protein
VSTSWRRHAVVGAGDVSSEADPAAAARFSITFVLYAVPALAMVLVLMLRSFSLIADEPWWTYAIAIGGSTVLGPKLDRWIDAPRGTWRLHVRVLVHAVTVMSVIYLTGWGPALGVCFVYAALVDLQASGPASWRAVLGWSAVCCTAGQIFVWLGWAPSLLDGAAAQTLGFLGMFAFGIVIAMAGAIGAAKEDAEQLLAAATEEMTRSEALHRAVVENAAEGIFTIGSDGFVLSFNESAEAIFGWPAAEIVGRPAKILLTEELRPYSETYLETTRQAGHDAARHRSWEVLGARRDGTSFPMAISTSAIVVAPSAPITSCLVRDLSEQKELESRLSHQATHDALTGLPNRAMLIDRVDQALTRSRRHHRMCGALYVDLDRFKTVNDTLGHASGDLLLLDAANRLREVVRETDTVARLGGDEFVVLCEELDGVHDATDLAQRILATLSMPFSMGVERMHVSGSIGIALSVDGNATADEILANADMAMYRAKDSGRNRYELFDAAMQQWVTTQIELEKALQQAVARNELRLHYQPIIETDTGRIRGLEALVRWERPGFGLVGPDEFISAAEDSGLIVEMGAWVLSQACEDAARWAKRWPGRQFGVSVNVASRQLAKPDIVEVITATLARTGLDPTLLTLELTESTLIDDTVNTQTILHELRGLGLNLSLDDFGTGYSSISYLQRFTFDVVKIDRSFIKPLGEHPSARALVDSMISMARALNLPVVAEGVETETHLAMLKDLGCSYLQGFLFARPMPLSQLEEHLAAHIGATGSTTAPDTAQSAIR